MIVKNETRVQRMKNLISFDIYHKKRKEKTVINSNIFIRDFQLILPIF